VQVAPRGRLSCSDRFGDGIADASCFGLDERDEVMFAEEREDPGLVAVSNDSSLELDGLFGPRNKLHCTAATARPPATHDDAAAIARLGGKEIAWD